MLIGIAGKAQSGKDTTAKMIKKILANKYETYMDIYHIAQPLKQLCAHILHIKEKDLEKEEVKNTIIPDRLYKDFGKITVRQLLQYMGTDILKGKVCKDFFTHCIPSMYYRETIYTDVRFKEEADWIKKKHGYIIKIVRDTDRIDNHSSEQIDFDADFTIHNNKTKHHLRSKLHQIIPTILEKYY